MSDHKQMPSVEAPHAAPALPLIARRQLIRGAAAALPTILTLQSGAALASTSYGVVSGTSIPEGGVGGSPTIDGQYHCLNTGGQKSGTWDLSFSDEVTNITAGQQYTYTPPGSLTEATAYGDEMCRTGAENVRFAGSETPGTDTVPNGMLLSATAYTSLDASGAITVIREL